MDILEIGHLEKKNAAITNKITLFGRLKGTSNYPECQILSATQLRFAYLWVERKRPCTGNKDTETTAYHDCVF